VQLNGAKELNIGGTNREKRKKLYPKELRNRGLKKIK
jgi:hypothetical protein